MAEELRAVGEGSGMFICWHGFEIVATVGVVREYGGKSRNEEVCGN